MTEWNYDLSAAPRGRYEEEVLPGRAGSTRTIRRHVADKVILATKSGLVITSRWLPPDEVERRPKGRWEFLGSKEEPEAWQPYPKHPRESGNA